jgi:peptidoglycan hydrolase-like amidase
LCQEGAKKMAEMGFNYIEILKFYFPELELGKIN